MSVETKSVYQQIWFPFHVASGYENNNSKQKARWISYIPFVNTFILSCVCSKWTFIWACKMLLTNIVIICPKGSQHKFIIVWKPIIIFFSHQYSQNILLFSLENTKTDIFWSVCRTKRNILINQNCDKENFKYSSEKLLSLELFYAKLISLRKK